MNEPESPNPADTPPDQIPVPGPGRSAEEVEVEIGGPPPREGEGTGDTVPQQARKENEKMVTWPPGFLEKSISPYVALDVPIVGEDTPVAEAARRLDNPLGVVLVTDAENHLKGIITKDDCKKLSQPSPPTTTAALGTTQSVVAIYNTGQVWQMLKIMNGENKAHRVVDALPVVDKATKRPVGVILRQALRERLPQDLAATQG